MSDVPVHPGPAPTRPRSSPRTAWRLVLVAGTVRVGIELWGIATSAAGTPVWRFLPTLLGGLVAIAGGVLLYRDDERGVGVVLVAGTFAAVTLFGSGPALIATGPAPSILWSLALLALVASAVLAWRARDPERWTPSRHAVHLIYLAAAVGVVLGAAFPAVAFAVRPIAGAPWWQPVAWGNGVTTVAGTVLGVLVLAVLLAAAVFLARALAAAVIGAIAVTSLGSATSGLLQATWASDLRFTPFGWLDLAASAVLLVIAVRWWAPPAVVEGQVAEG